MHSFEIIVGILLCVTLVVPLARWRNVSAAIAQVVAGLVLFAMPFAPREQFHRQRCRVDVT
jgi:hypothetical protein